MKHEEMYLKLTPTPIYIEPNLRNDSVLEFADGTIAVGITAAKHEPYRSALIAYDRERLIQEGEG